MGKTEQQYRTRNQSLHACWSQLSMICARGPLVWAGYTQRESARAIISISPWCAGSDVCQTILTWEYFFRLNNAELLCRLTINWQCYWSISYCQTRLVCFSYRIRHSAARGRSIQGGNPFRFYSVTPTITASQKILTWWSNEYSHHQWSDIPKMTPRL